MTRRRVFPWRPVPDSRIPRIRLSPADLRELATAAGRKGRTAQPMGSGRRAELYWQQTGRSDFTPGQYRRWRHKHNRLAGP